MSYLPTYGKKTTPTNSTTATRIPRFHFTIISVPRERPKTIAIIHWGLYYIITG